jgi:hypothetical protein
MVFLLSDCQPGISTATAVSMAWSSVGTWKLAISRATERAGYLGCVWTSFRMISEPVLEAAPAF